MKSVRRVSLDLLGADAAVTWDPDGGPRSKAQRRIRKAKALRDGGYGRFLEPGAKRRRRTRPPNSAGE